MARNPYDHGRRGPDSHTRDRLQNSGTHDRLRSSSFEDDYPDDLDDGRFRTRPMQRAGSGFAQSAPQPRGGSQRASRYGSNERRHGSYDQDRESDYAQPWGRTPQHHEPDHGSGAYGRDPRFGARYGGQHFGAYGYGMQESPYETQRRSRNRGPRNWQRSDERIREDVCERLSGLHDVDVSDVSVAVEQGRVTLAGTVTDRWHKHRIEDVADDSAGVREIENRIRVREDDGGGSGGFWSQLFGFDSGARARDVMTRDVLTASPGDSVQRAAQLMKDAGIGSVPVCDGQRLQGMVTDRDIAVRVVAPGLPADRTQVSQAMTSEVFWCYEDDDVGDVLDKMGDRQVRRIPVVDRDHRLTGIIALGDVAVQRSGAGVGEALEEISTPSSRAPMTGSPMDAPASTSTMVSGSQEHH